MSPRALGPGRLVLGLAFATVVLLLGCGAPQSILDPRSPGAAGIERLWWIALGSTGGLALIVIGALLWGVRRARRAAAARVGPEVDRREQTFLLLAGAAFPALFLAGFLVVSVRTGSEVAEPPGDPALTIEVVGHKFWWEVHYPDQGIVTANEFRIPAGHPVRVHVTSADVIHSFWFPQLSPGKIDMVPGRTNLIWMQADEPGTYRGQCTEFCGVQHALMSKAVIALPEGEFEEWVGERSRTREPPPEGRPREGMGVFLRRGCGWCHAVEGVSRPVAAGNPGPDLTDLASRSTLGALTIPNDAEHLRAWIEDPHRFKHGVRMPPNPLPEEEMDALIAFLETLR